MSNADVRRELAAAVDQVDGLTGYEKRPTVVKPFDAWPQWRGGERGPGLTMTNTWVVLILLPPDESTADEWADRLGDDLFDWLEPVMYVDRIDPATVKLSANDALALMITGHRE